VLSGSTLVKNGVFTNRYTADLVRTRRLHVEDWLAVIGFNHLFAGADAFVAAQLWDVPVQLTAVPRPSGALFVATVRF
jgi:adenylate cyclase